MTIITERKIEKRKRQKDRRKSLGENESRHPNMNLLLLGMWTNTSSACPNRIWPRSRTHLKGMYTHTHTSRRHKHTLHLKQTQSFSTWLGDRDNLPFNINTLRWVTSQTQLCCSYVVNTHRHQIKLPLLKCLRSSFISRWPEETLHLLNMC